MTRSIKRGVLLESKIWQKDKRLGYILLFTILYSEKREDLQICGYTVATSRANKTVFTTD